ncbi:glutathione S-transferase family protein [Algicella marina]|uniref:Glutathione S-transferase family protein n=1 Tax=Algicella marina TaxID=2683284 RepID=A0A6P1T2C8_9RHOB|nr:glutathione S-transferase family protein [Algicella marina]QHQ35813.1 glutathione S-transferase family protein [Algicella marina]
MARRSILHVSRNPNPRLAAASARFIGAEVEIVHAAPLAPGEDARFRPLNPTLLLPILKEPGRAIWECDAVVCRMAMMAGSDFFPRDDRLPELLKWISWGKENFVRACNMVQFELGTKLRYDLGPSDMREVDAGTALFHTSAQLLDAELRGAWLLGSAPSYADFRMATFLPFNDIMRLPLGEYPALSAWYAGLCELPEWRDPFDGIEMPALPPVRP